MAVGAIAQTTIPEGTVVKLKFDQAVSSKTAKAGDRVKMHVSDNVVIGGKTVLAAGTPAMAVISSVKGRGRYGKNAQLQLTLNPVRYHGTTIELQPREQGKQFKGSKTDKAAIATGAGAVILGPIGLVGGYFITGKEVRIKVGDELETQVSRTVKVK